MPAGAADDASHRAARTFAVRQRTTFAGTRTMPAPIFLRLAQLPAYVGLSRSSIYARIKARQFPAPIPLGGAHIVAFATAEVDAWAAEQIRSARDTAALETRAEKSATASARRRDALAKQKAVAA